VTFEFRNLQISGMLRQCVREWGSEGAAERAQSFDPLLHAVDSYFTDRTEEKINVLVPGSGLGRLPWELSKRGYAVEACEFTYFMLLPASFILQGARGIKYTLHPYATESKNVLSARQQLRAIEIPDVEPTGVPTFNIAQGDWLSLYGRQKMSSLPADLLRRPPSPPPSTTTTTTTTAAATKADLYDDKQGQRRCVSLHSMRVFGFDLLVIRALMLSFPLVSGTILTL